MFHFNHLFTYAVHPYSHQLSLKCKAYSINQSSVCMHLNDFVLHLPKQTEAIISQSMFVNSMQNSGTTFMGEVLNDSLPFFLPFFFIYNELLIEDTKKNKENKQTNKKSKTCVYRQIPLIFHFVFIIIVCVCLSLYTVLLVSAHIPALVFTCYHHITHTKKENQLIHTGIFNF